MPILDEHTLDFISHSPEQTRRFGVRLGALLQEGDLVCLEGDLGTGKTCLVQGVGGGMGIVEPITSPTFTLVAEYRPPPPAPILYHVDLYRLDAPVNEAWAFGLDDYLGGYGACIIEWADRVKTALPAGAHLGSRSDTWILGNEASLCKRLAAITTNSFSSSAKALLACKVAQMLLAIDTATRMAGLALYDHVSNWILGEETWHSVNNHTVELMPRLAHLLKQQGISRR